MSIVALTPGEARQYERLKGFEAKSLNELRERAQDLHIENHWRMSKKELLQAIWQRYN